MWWGEGARGGGGRKEGKGREGNLNNIILELLDTGILKNKILILDFFNFVGHKVPISIKLQFPPLANSSFP